MVYTQKPPGDTLQEGLRLLKNDTDLLVTFRMVDLSRAVVALIEIDRAASPAMRKYA